MNEAITTQAESSRQRVLDAHRGQLRLVRSRIDAYWREHAASFDGDGTSEQRFLRLIEDGVAEGAVILGAEGRVEYPDRTRPGSHGREIEMAIASAERL